MQAFDLEPGYTNLQTISRGVSPRAVIDGVVDTFRRDNDIRSGGNLVPGRENAIRKQLAAYVNCAPEEIAITRNTTEGVTTVLCGWKLHAGDEILTTTQEHDAFYDMARLPDSKSLMVLSCGRSGFPCLRPRRMNSPKRWRQQSLPAHG
jgi:selenocysteine lyase/cysteine desulfurase